MHHTSLNWTKVGLKGYATIGKKCRARSLNWTKVGLKDMRGGKCCATCK